MAERISGLRKAVAVGALGLGLGSMFHGFSYAIENTARVHSAEERADRKFTSYPSRSAYLRDYNSADLSRVDEVVTMGEIVGGLFVTLMASGKLIPQKRRITPRSRGASVRV